MVECFPEFREMDFEFGPANDEQYLLRRMGQQNQWIMVNGVAFAGSGTITSIADNNDEDDDDSGDDNNEIKLLLLGGINAKDNPTGVAKSLAQFAYMTKIMKMAEANAGEAINIDSNKEDDNGDSGIRIPFLYADLISQTDIFVDTFYDDIRRYLRFDEETCCKQKPYPAETVFVSFLFHDAGFVMCESERELFISSHANNRSSSFHTQHKQHFRNFAEEAPMMSKKIGNRDLDPQQTAIELFGHLEPGNKVAIITRYESETAQPYVDALEERGLVVRVIQGQTGNEDFCFLMNTHKEMIGIVYSTYLFWAGVLSKTCQRVVAYSVNTKARAKSGRVVYMKYNWTHPELKRKMKFQLIEPWNNVTTTSRRQSETTTTKRKGKKRKGRRRDRD